MNIKKHHFSQFSPCLSLQNIRFRNPCRKVLPKLFYTRKHSNCSCESINFTSSVIVSSDHDAETRATSPLFRKCAAMACLFSLIFYLLSISVIEIGSDNI